MRRQVHRLFMVAVALAVVGVGCPGAAASPASADPVWAAPAVPNFPDALAGGPLAGEAGQPMLLLNSIGPVAEPVAAYLFTHAGETTAVRAFGGPAAVTDRSLNDVARVLAGTYFPQPF